MTSFFVNFTPTKFEKLARVPLNRRGWRFTCVDAVQVLAAVALAVAAVELSYFLAFRLLLRFEN